VSHTFIQARNHGGTQTSVRRIVIHGTVSPCVRGGARAVANDFHRTHRDASAHYVVDPGHIVQCLKETTIGFHAPPNNKSIGIELCDPQKGSSARWRDANHEAMLRLAAELVREVAARWKVPLVKLSTAEVQSLRHGICGHVNVSHAFHMTDHTDPGKGFPWAHFMSLVTHGKPAHEDADKVPAFPGRLLTQPPIMRGDDVRTWQAQMSKRGHGLDVDGAYGPGSEQACRAFQQEQHLAVDGVVGPNTWHATFAAPIKAKALD
jgi:N-acetyl-anhydromuramyl-L-alanine amidase AmpD